MTKSTLTKRGFVAANDDEVEDGEVAAPKTAKKAKSSPKKVSTCTRGETSELTVCRCQL